MMGAILSAAAWVVLNAAIVTGALWVWGSEPRTARRTQGMILLTSFLLFIPGLAPLLLQDWLLQRVVFFPLGVAVVSVVLLVVLEVRFRVERRRRRREDLLRGYPPRPRIIDGWGAFWIGVVTGLVAWAGLFGAAFVRWWVSALVVVADGGLDHRWDGISPNVSPAMSGVGLVIGVVVGVAVWRHGVMRAQDWEQLQAGLQHRETVAAQHAVLNQAAGSALVE